jgi:hypothetical protein
MGEKEEFRKKSLEGRAKKGSFLGRANLMTHREQTCSRGSNGNNKNQCLFCLSDIYKRR